MSDKQVEKWRAEYDGYNTDQKLHWWSVFNEKDEIVYSMHDKERDGAKLLAERIANLPVLEDGHRQMKELLIELMGDIAGLIDGRIDGEGCQHRIYLLLARMGGA